ncbi:MAG: InlB B-repeat-containing protein [Prevotella sp.]|nr:InlB B-repeat-containing protein [Prevotella sp.]
MKKQLLILLAVLLTSVTAIALTAMPALTGVITVTFTVDPEGAGDVLLSGKKTTSTMAFSGANMTISATANPGYEFAGWYIDNELKGTEASSFTFTTAETDMTVVAKFNALAASNLTLSVKAGCEGMGTVSVSPVGTVTSDNHKYTAGTEVTISASPAKGYQFDHWELSTGETFSTASSYKFTISSDMTIYAVFSKLSGYKDDLIAFPGAEGYGRFTTGGRMIDGRGSKVYYVTRLDDCSDNDLVEGTLRWALKSGDDTPRTVLFKVAGTIYLTSRLMGAKPNVTIAGQTAPGGGICIAGYQMKLSNNTIVRHIRFRASDLPYNNSMSQLDVENVNNIIMDHCTFAWSMEENLTMYDTDYTTVQWCIFSEPLYGSGNAKGERAYGAQWGGEHGTMHHCLFAHCMNRAPRFNGVRNNVNDRQVDSEFLNNVIFNWGSHNSIYGGECSTTGSTKDTDYNRVYMINNYYKPGPATQKGANGSRYFVRPTGGTINDVGEWYLSGNKFETGSKWAGTDGIWKDETLEKVNADNYWGYLEKEKGRAFEFWSLTPTQELYDQKLLKSLPAGYELTMGYESADEAYHKVVTQAGASLPRYDEVDARVLKEAAGEIDPQFKGEPFISKKDDKEEELITPALGIINSPYDITLQTHDEFAALSGEIGKEIDVTCFPRLQTDSDDCRVIDTDGDGLPDAYEVSVGLNPNDASDGMKLTESGYSNLEIFLNDVADGTIDAKLYTKHPKQTGLQSFNAIVGEGEQYQTVQAAIDAAPADDTPYYVFVKKGVYEGHVQINRANVHLTGQNKANTIISWNKVYNEDGGNVDTNATINVTADDVSFDNLTIRNTRQKAGQALALYTKADRIAITSCNLEGWQDTYRTGNDGHRHIIRNSKISGTTDFIYNRGEAFFEGDTLHVLQGSNVIVAPDHIRPNYGYVFRNCVITAAEANAQTHLGRPWGDTPKASFINTRLTEGVTIPAEGWRDMDGLPTQMAECNTMDASGNPVDLSGRKTTFANEKGETCTSKAVLGKVEADSYQLDYMLRGTDEWDADWQAFILPAPAVYVNNGTISWVDHTGYARRYLVSIDGVATITTETSRADDGKTVVVQAISPYGVLSEEGSSANPTAIDAVKSNAPVVQRYFFTADGRQHQRLQHGLNIIREQLSDGTQRTVKVVAK